MTIYRSVTKKIVLVFLVCFVEVLVIGLLLTHRRRPLSVTPLQKHTLQYSVSPSFALRHYYGLQANTVQEDDMSILGMTGTASHTINADGLAGEQEYAVIKPEKTFRIISMGDSFTQGAFVGTKYNYSTILESLLNERMSCSDIDHFEVINLGVSGYDMQYSVERFKDKGMKYTPDLILFWILDNDFLSNNEKYSDLFEQWDPLIEAPAAVEQKRKEGDFYPEANVVFDRFHTIYTDEELISEEMVYFREFLALSDTPIVMFTIQGFPSTIKKRIQEAIMIKSNVRFYTEIPDSYAKLPDSHPSIEGHRQYAEYLFQKIKTVFLRACTER